MACCILEQCRLLYVPVAEKAINQPPGSTCSWKHTSRCDMKMLSSTFTCHLRPSMLPRRRHLVPHANHSLPTLSLLSDENPSKIEAACTSDDADVLGVQRAALLPLLVVAFGACALFLGEPALAQTHEKAGVDLDMTALALGPEGPLVEEFWENVTRYIAYFFTVASGGAYAIVKPITELLRKPITAFFVVTALGGGAVITWLTLSSMLGLSETPDPYQF